jgi:hypothetical protein
VKYERELLDELLRAQRDLQPKSTDHAHSAFANRHADV